MRYGGLFLQYVAEELPEICANLFLIPTGRENTAVFGGSMGGYGALKVALNHPERFGACVALSPCCLMIGEEMDDLRQTPAEQAEQTWGSTLMRDFHAIFGPELALCPAGQSGCGCRAGRARAMRRGCISPAAGRINTWMTAAITTGF